MSIDNALLGNAIRQIRQMQGFTQGVLSSKAGLQANTVALIERGQRSVSIESLNALAKALNVPAGCLTMLGTTKTKGDAESSALIGSIQEAILSTMLARTSLQAREKAAKENQTKLESIRSGPQLKALVRKASLVKSMRAIKGSKKAKKAKAASRKQSLEHA